MTPPQTYNRRESDANVEQLKERVADIDQRLEHIESVIEQMYGAVKLIKMLAWVCAAGAAIWTFMTTNFAVKIKAAAVSVLANLG